MKLPIIAVLGAGLIYAQTSFAAEQTSTVHPTPAQPNQAQTNTVLTTQKDKVSYSIGVDLGENFKSQNMDIDPTMFAKGLQDALNNRPTAITKQEMANTLMAYQKELLAKKESQFKSQSAQNQQEGNAYLEANKKKSGVITTASGLQYKVINAGKGESPSATDVVTVDYKGSFLNGKVFDSSYDRKKSITFPVAEVIPGWQEVLKLMKPGSTYEVVVPANLAYGEHGMGNAIGPNQTLLFTIHLVSVKKSATA